ncbi:bacillithiol biosynthesis deacetylase BshB1 [Heliobacterium gestii]|uniref:Bacillithiol biosynthesis deacetylase BshB1 n=1 Tax=Heliomicrobium gestii TaxID=2699 RepID=A0A845LEG2_HELGE|nr:bacillithiol biosynthesis deacetylase BshB1 [Heliomicrobium gestii]MBM7867501.1 bacillithiol biosynthesis deacetylase BshB1 [Heliomicrobium gestii]MZP43951.1 bacillithiol biosynthesis deacetylase BshB1 [Heliomicrobium gestii]
MENHGNQRAPEEMAPADVLVIGAHPDDVELGVGGTVALAANQGLQVVIVDLTEGEMASSGTVVARRAEAKEAAEVLGVRERINCRWEDGGLSDPAQWRRRVEELALLLRRYRPRLALAPQGPDRHPDHEAAGRLAREALFYSGLKKFGDPELAPWRPKRFLAYRINGALDGLSAYSVDVSAVYDRKQAALACFQSQFFREQRETRQALNVPDLPALLEARDRYLGGMIGTAYAEPLYPDGPIRIGRLDALWE